MRALGVCLLCSAFVALLIFARGCVEAIGSIGRESIEIGYFEASCLFAAPLLMGGGIVLLVRGRTPTKGR